MPRLKQTSHAILAALMTLAVLLPTPSRAAEPVEQETVEKGKPAPFSGVLLSPARAAETAAIINRCYAERDESESAARAMIRIEQRACEARQRVLANEASEMSAALTESLNAERAKSKALEETVASSEVDATLGIVTGAAVGTLVGLVVGALATTGVFIYVSLQP